MINKFFCLKWKQYYKLRAILQSENNIEESKQYSKKNNKEEKIILKNNLKQKIKIENRIEVISLKIIF